MSAREWGPGDVASINATQPAFRTDNGWTYIDGSTAGLEADDYGFRPLVVIDPEDREQVERFMHTYWRGFGNFSVMVDRTDVLLPKAQAALREFANLTPPKPEEPTGLGAVVEDGAGNPYVRAPGRGDRVWVDEFSKECRYADIDVVRVLSEGVIA